MAGRSNRRSSAAARSGRGVGYRTQPAAAPARGRSRSPAPSPRPAPAQRRGPRCRAHRLGREGRRSRRRLQQSTRFVVAFRSQRSWGMEAGARTRTKEVLHLEGARVRGGERLRSAAEQRTVAPLARLPAEEPPLPELPPSELCAPHCGPRTAASESAVGYARRGAPNCRCLRALYVCPPPVRTM